MIDREVVKEFLVAQFEDFTGIPNDINLDKLSEDFSVYTENDYYEWLRDNFKTYFFQRGFDWDNVREKLQNGPTQPV